jgi:hypothetical protein
VTVRRYRDVSEMPAVPSRPADLAVIREVFARALELAPPSYTRGVERFHDMTEAQEARARVVAARAHALRAARLKLP